MREFDFFDRDQYRLRLRLLRKHMKMNQQQFAEHLGIPFKRWNHYERGYPIPRETAFILMEKIKGLDPMWIWFGWDFAKNMSEDLYLDLKLLARQEAAEKPAHIGEAESVRQIKSAPRRISRASKPSRRSGKE